MERSSLAAALWVVGLAAGGCVLDEEEREPASTPRTSAMSVARLDAVIRRVGLRAVGVRDGVVHDASLESLDADAMRAWFEDVQVVAGTERNVGLEADLASASRVTPVSPLAPTADQRQALREAASAAIGPMRIRWNGRRGVPSRIEGALAVRRGRDAAVLAAEWLESQAELLRRLTTSDARDVLEPVASSSDDEAHLDSIVFARYRDALRVLGDHVEVFVTRASHPWGAGVVARVGIAWDREVEPGPATSLISEQAAVSLAEDALGRSLAHRSSRLIVRCASLRDRPHRCRPTWDVYAIAGSGSALAAGSRADHAQIHARTGELLRVSRVPREARGTVDVSSHWPFDTSDVTRDFARVALTGMGVHGIVRGSTDWQGGFDLPFSTSTATVELATYRWPVIELIHTEPWGCEAPVSAPRQRTISVWGPSTVEYAIDPLHASRTEALMFQWMVYLSQMLASDFAGVTELPSTIWFDAEPFMNPAMRICDAERRVAFVGIDGRDDTPASSAQARAFTAEEYQLAVQWCSEDLGPGCAFTDDPETAFSSPWNEGMGHMIAGWFTRYEDGTRLLASTRELRYQGAPPAAGPLPPEMASDVFLHDEEISELAGGTATGPEGCSVSPDDYGCSATEACWIDLEHPFTYAQGKPRCMPRVPMPLGYTTSYQDAARTWCRERFPNVREDLVDAQPYGRSPTETDVMICVHDNYANARVFANLGAQLFHTDGYRGGLAAMWGADRDRPANVELTRGPVNFHERFADHGGDYEVSDAFHTISAESFPWLDDATNVRSHAEVIRVPRDEPLTFSRSGATGAALRFDSVHDVDQLLLFGDRGGSYRLSVIPVDGAVDGCAVAYDWISGVVLGMAPGCTDGASSPSAELTVAMPESRRVAFRVFNVLHTVGEYAIRVESIGDDYPSRLADAATAQPLRPGASISGSLETARDVDVFRYDVPLGDEGALTFATSPTHTPLTPVIEVYPALGIAMPTGAPIASGSGSVTIAAPTPGLRYYAVLRTDPQRPGAIPYSLRVEQAGCDPPWQCNDRGTYDEPRYLPSSIGGHVWNALDQGSGPDAHEDWHACFEGRSCDWYRVELREGERLTVTLSKVDDSRCNLEVAVIAPPIQRWWTDFTAPGSPVAAVVTDQGGSMEPDGAQLTFVARGGGTHRIRVRGTTDAGCASYELTATRGARDADQPPRVH
ncbi:MAG: hypothetical protein IT379_10925 [Deltaproteobacteria bacterium]|nr:hypothetical protein [Deltaproteobacteria bacterium]